jgi:hypothetical protein
LSVVVPVDYPISARGSIVSAAANVGFVVQSIVEKPIAALMAKKYAN